MIPLRDDNPSQTVPVVTRALIIDNIVSFLYEVSLGPALTPFLFGWGLVPQRLALAVSGVVPFPPAAVTVLSSMFLHGGWIHLTGNMWYLWIFGDNVEDEVGHLRFLFFYLAGGVASALLHTLFNSHSSVPTVGASGAIACVLGAYAVLFPRARVVTLVLILFFIQIVSLPALVVLGLWFVMQFFSGTLSLAAGAGTGASGGVAWWAHVGGFVFGMLLVLPLRRQSPSRARIER